MILKISLGHKKLKTRKRTKMKCSAGCCSFEYHTYISVTPNIDFRTLYERCVHQTQFLAGRKTRAARTQDAGAVDARRGRYGRKTRALWTQDAGAVDARRGRRGRKTRADAVLSYFLAVLYMLIIYIEAQLVCLDCMCVISC